MSINCRTNSLLGPETVCRNLTLKPSTLNESDISAGLEWKKSSIFFINQNISYKNQICLKKREGGGLGKGNGELELEW